MLVGGGELHDRWSSLVRTSAPLRRGIQRFTGITQAMVDGAPPLESVLPPSAELLRGRVMVAHNAPSTAASCARRSSAIGLEWPDPPVICTAALARAMLPLQRERGLSVLADALGIEVAPGAPRARRRRDLRARAVRAVPAAVRERVDGRGGAQGDRAPAPGRRGSRARARKGQFAAAARARARQRARVRASSRAIPACTCSATTRGRVLYVGKSVSIRSRARAHFAPSAPPARRGPRTRRSSTTARPAPSSARWCSRTG